MNRWPLFFLSYPRNIRFLILVVGSFISVALFSKFMIWNEQRPGSYINDPVLAAISPVDLSLFTGLMTNLPILIGLIEIMRKPINTVYLLFAAIGICLFRTLTLYFVILEPPLGIIPLHDPILETFFYGGSVLLKDLFFSGHTANILLVGLLVENIYLKRMLIFCSAIVGMMLIIQHVHYTIDVVAAPLFAVLTYKLTIFVANTTFLRDIKTDKREGKLRCEFGLKS